jgi:ATP phosphoribosyltransferase regulatory subunit
MGLPPVPFYAKDTGMTKIPPDLLPEGFRDRLPPQAESAARISRAMLDVLTSHGYNRVTPSIVEFEETMAARSSTGKVGLTGRDRLLRFSDPVSGHTLALRGDITVQVGRIATTRMAGDVRPLRLSYYGSVLRLRAAALRPEREVTQLGAELIGSDSIAAASEIVAVAIEALEAAGVNGIIVDFTLPDLVETLAAKTFKIPKTQIDEVRSALDMKDAGRLKTLGAEKYLPLLYATGPFEDAVTKLKAIDAKGDLASRISALEAIAERLSSKAVLTLDPSERHGFEYQSWFGFTLFAEGYTAALGRGGTYAITSEDGSAEVATGFSLYPDPLVDHAASGIENKRLFLPLGTVPVKAARLRAEGWITVAALDENCEAVKLDCAYILSNGKAKKLAQ